jgi:hypothetical protein
MFDGDEIMKGIDFSQIPLDKNTTKTLIEDDNFDFQVTNPTLQSGHIVYMCKGVDKQGNWEGNRRYNEFFLLHEALHHRWPGMYIPMIPPK